VLALVLQRCLVLLSFPHHPNDGLGHGRRGVKGGGGRETYHLSEKKRFAKGGRIHAITDKRQ
jgi:hypothetical protein